MDLARKSPARCSVRLAKMFDRNVFRSLHFSSPFSWRRRSGGQLEFFRKRCTEGRKTWRENVGRNGLRA
ncbi:hypothetical protein ZHAS_00012275 [Anopheles sinensis]|uniref:Uncharacterized protein n=1 Tax=Anopheles sinensis TaxID=74873 RepID=A0A084W293_ANOSI|nr:hypothetical protein ZHAS_00012275 [Anopheles sinensis]